MPGVNPVQPHQGAMQQVLGMVQGAKGVMDLKNGFGGDAAKSPDTTQAAPGTGPASPSDNGAGSQYDPITNQLKAQAIQRKISSYPQGGGGY